MTARPLYRIVMRSLTLTLTILVLVGLARSATRGQNARPDQPPTTSSGDLEETKEFRTAGMTLRPPAPSDEPGISSEEAAELAWEERVPGEPSSVDARFAILSKADVQRRPVWMVTYTGVCIPVYGPIHLTNRPDCGGSVWHVILDADTGELEVAISG